MNMPACLTPTTPPPTTTTATTATTITSTKTTTTRTTPTPTATATTASTTTTAATAATVLGYFWWACIYSLSLSCLLRGGRLLVGIQHCMDHYGSTCLSRRCLVFLGVGSLGGLVDGQNIIYIYILLGTRFHVRVILQKP